MMTKWTIRVIALAIFSAFSAAIHVSIPSYNPPTKEIALVSIRSSLDRTELIQKLHDAGFDAKRMRSDYRTDHTAGRVQEIAQGTVFVFAVFGGGLAAILVSETLLLALVRRFGRTSGNRQLTYGSRGEIDKTKNVTR